MKMFKSLNKGLLLAGTSSVLVLALIANAQNAFSQNTILIPNSTQVGVAQPTLNTGSLPFQISVDGKAIDGSGRVGAANSLDSALERMDIQMTFDGLKLDKSLNMTTDLGAYAPGETVTFRGFWNYGAFIENAEIRVFDAGTSTDGTPLVVLDVSDDRVVEWSYPQGMPGEVQYVLRVYGKNGNFDETTSKSLTSLADAAALTHDLSDGAGPSLAGYGQNSLNKNGIVVTGGTVTVFGSDVPPGNNVRVLGAPIPVDGSGKFVATEIMPSGDHQVAISVLDAQGRGLEFERALFVPGSDLFYVGLGDFTVGTGKTSGPTELVGENSEWGDIYTQGRVAAFVRGKVADSILVTAQADTGEAPIDELFVNFLDRDPSKLTNRLETNETYATFGDSSSIERVVNTQGKFYVKVEQGDSHALWGNYQTRINGPVFASINRSLYGANVSYRSDALQTPNGNPAIEADVFVAQQGTVGQRDLLRGTGGSVYFLTYQDVLRGGERVAIEVRDSITGMVVSKRELVYGQDYDFDSIQGRIILVDALPSTADGTDNPTYLVVDYEYSPKNFDQFKDLYYGGRVVGRLGDWVTVGGTYLRDENSAPGTSARQLIGGDIGLSMGGNSYVRAEVAQTEGDPTTEFGSDDGGYTVGDNNASAVGVDGAMAYRVDALVDTSDFTDAFAARLQGYYQHKDKGVAVANGFAGEDTDEFGVSVSAPIADIVTLSARYDNRTISPTVGDDTVTTTASVNASSSFDRISVGAGASFSETKTGSNELSSVSLNGNASYKLSDLLTVGANASTQLEDSAGNTGSTTLGVTANSQVTDRLKIGVGAGYTFKNDGTGDGSYNAKISSDYNLDDRTHLTVGYNVRDITGNFANSALEGDLNFGFKRKMTDSLNFYIEERLAHRGENIEGLTHMFGVDYAPTDAWRGSVNVELGQVGDLDRQAVSVNAGYRGEGFNIGAAGEYRRDEDTSSATSDVRQTYVAKANASLNLSEDWTAQGNVSLVMSEKNGNFVDGNFVQGTVGAAYRPVANNTLNGLFRYTFLYDLPTDTKADANLGADGTIGSATTYKQRSHILEADGIWNINENFSLGAKYGVRFGEVTTSRTTDDWVGDTIHLGIARVDWHVVRNWDALLEGRVMYQQDTQAIRYGAVAAVYRHFGDNFKVGVGYNFGAFNDDLTNVSFDSQGLFLNAIAKF